MPRQPMHENRRAGRVARTGVLAGLLALALGPMMERPMTAQTQGRHGDHAAGRHMEHRFDDPDQYAQSFDDPARDEWQMPDRVIDALAIESGHRVADIGAGTGYFTVRLAARSDIARVYAVDIEPAMVDYITERAGREGLDTVTAVLASADGPNLPEPVDRILIVNTYHHIPNRVAYFRALTERLRPGGRLAIVDYRPGAEGGGPPDEFRFTAAEIDAELSEAGFERDAAHDFLPRQHLLIYRPTD